MKLARTLEFFFILRIYKSSAVKKHVPWKAPLIRRHASRPKAGVMLLRRSPRVFTQTYEISVCVPFQGDAWIYFICHVKACVYAEVAGY